MKLLSLLLVMTFSTASFANCKQQEQLLDEQARNIEESTQNGSLANDPELRDFFLKSLEENRVGYEVLCKGRKIKVKSFCEQQKDLLDKQAQNIEESAKSGSLADDPELHDFYLQGLVSNTENAEKLCGSLK